MRLLSKSRLLSFRQCPKRLWLEVYRHDLNTDQTGNGVKFTAGASVGEVARHLFDPAGAGVLVKVTGMELEKAFARSAELLQTEQPLFEAGFVGGGATAFADVLLPVDRHGSLAWRMIEVKSSSTLKDYQRDDVAIQAYVARQANLPLDSIAVATVDSAWVYPGEGDYRGLLLEDDMTEETHARESDVADWIAQARAVLESRQEPVKPTGKHCSDPFDCGFLDYCQSREPPIEYPVAWLPNIRTKALKAHIAEQRVLEMAEVPDELLNPIQRRVKVCTLSSQAFFDADGAAQALAPHGFPAFFLDFETISFAVPIWAGTRPYQPVTFQFSVHRLTGRDDAEHREFLDLSGKDPRQALATALVLACETAGPIYVYSSYEKTRLSDLIRDFPSLADGLARLQHRLVDLRPIAETYYYHPSQQGSWSIKKVLPALTNRSYDELEGIRDGGMAMEAYLEAIAPETAPDRRLELDRQLRQYCALDTQAMIEIWAAFVGLE